MWTWEESLQAWWGEELEGDANSSHSGPLPETRGDLWADLCAMNGGLQVYGWGCISPRGDVYPGGLAQDDALTLMQLTATLHGMAFAHCEGGDETGFWAAVGEKAKRRWAKVRGPNQGEEAQ